MPPENYTSQPSDQIKIIREQLAWCIADSSPIKSALKKLGLDTKSAQEVVYTLHRPYVLKNATDLANRLDTPPKQSEPGSPSSPPSIPEHSHVGYYIKTTVGGSDESPDEKQSHVNISLMLNTTTKQVAIIIKPKGVRKENTSYFEGTLKRATKSVKLTLNPEGILTVSPVMAIKANSDVDAKYVSDELHADNALPTDSCLFINGQSNIQGIKNAGKRIGTVRHYQANKGVTIFDHIKDKQNKGQQKTVQMALRYMDQVGSQLTALHDQGRAHFDCKPQNILYEKNSGQFTVIDIPEEQYDPCVQIHPGQPAPNVTWGYTMLPIPTWFLGENWKEVDWSSNYTEIDNIFVPQKQPWKWCALAVRHLGHVSDSYAYLRGLYDIADSIPDFLFLFPPAEKTALKKFVLDQMHTLNDQVLAYKESNAEHSRWPANNMTVAKVKDAFNDFCKKPKNSLQSAFETSQQPAATATAYDGAVTAPTTADIVLKESKNKNLLIKLWVHLLRKILPDGETKQALSSEVTLSQYSTPDSQNAGWQVVADAQSIQDSGFQEERLRLARVLVVAEVTQKLQESPGVNVEDCVTQVMNERLATPPSGNTTASPNDDFTTKLIASQASIAETVKSIQASLKPHGDRPPTMLLQEANKLIPLLHNEQDKQDNNL